MLTHAVPCTYCKSVPYTKTALEWRNQAMKNQLDGLPFFLKYGAPLKMSNFVEEFISGRKPNFIANGRIPTLLW